MTRPFISFEQMRENAAVILPVYEQFKTRADQLLKEKNGTVTGYELDLIIDRLIIEKCKSEEEYHLADAFFDTYLGAWNTQGREAAEQLALMLGATA